MDQTPTTDLPADSYCKSCRYPLRGLSRNKCPECGRAFDPADRKTYWVGPPMRRFTRWLANPPGLLLKLLAVGALLLMVMAGGWFDLVGDFSVRYLLRFENVEIWQRFYDEPGGQSRSEWYFAGALVIWALIFFALLLRAPFRLWAGINYGDWNTSGKRRRVWVLPLLLLLTTCTMGVCWPYHVMAAWRHDRSTSGVSPSSALLTPSGAVAVADVNMESEEIFALSRQAFTRSRDRAVRLAALNWMLFDGRAPEEILQTLRTAAVDERDDEVRAWLLRLVSFGRDAQDAQLMMTNMGHENAEVRAAAADGLGIIHHPAFLFHLRGHFGFWQTSDGPAAMADPPIDLNYSQLMEFFTTSGPGPRQEGYGWQEPVELPDRFRDALVTMMTHGETQAEREAAARALIMWPGDDYRLRVAEWGVWLVQGTEIKLVQSVIDEIPPFVHRLGNVEKEFHDRINQIMVVTKPIVHLTVDRPLAIDLELQINRGRPWFAYPRPNDFNLHVDTDPQRFVRSATGDWQPYGELGHTLALLDPPRLARLEPLAEGYPWMQPRHRRWGSNAGRIGDSRDLLSLGARWQSLVVSPKQLSWMTPPVIPATDDDRYDWWRRLREVPSSWVHHMGESERFVYYDGPTLLHAPVLVNWRDDAIELRPIKPASELRGTEDDPYAAKRADGALAFENAKAGFKPVVPIEGDPPTARYRDSRREALAIECAGEGGLVGWRVPVPESRARFQLREAEKLEGDAVVEALRELLTADGLTVAEADGLIESWRPQFFQTRGRRVILKMSGADYDRFCPMSIRPAPTELARVGLLLYEFGAGESQ